MQGSWPSMVAKSKTWERKSSPVVERKPRDQEVMESNTAGFWPFSFLSVFENSALEFKKMHSKPCIFSESRHIEEQKKRKIEIFLGRLKIL